MGDQELSVELPPHARLTGLAFDEAIEPQVLLQKLRPSPGVHCPPALPSLVKFLG